MAGNILVDGADRPSNAIAQKDCLQILGQSIPNTAIYVASGSLDGVTGSSTGSTTLAFDTYGFKVRRVEVFHSGAAPGFDVSLESRNPNAGSDFDPRDIVVQYNQIKGSDDFSQGIDVIEDLIALADSGGRLYLNFKPYDAGDNSFKYLLILEAVIVYINKDNTLNGS